MKTIKYSISLSFLPVILFTMCTLNIRPDNGGASETVNASIIIKDTVAEIQTTAEKDFEMEVYIIKDSYSPLDSVGIYNSSVVSNSNGLKKSNSPGKYNIFLFIKDSLLSCSFFEVELFKEKSDTLTDTFSLSGSISGSVTIAQPVPVLVFLRGTPFSKRLIDDYTYTFQHVPSGSYTIIAEVDDTGWKGEDLEASDSGFVERPKFKVKSSPLQESQEIELESGGSIRELNLILSD